MFCKNCGERMEEGDRFCATCGARAGQVVLRPSEADLNPVLEEPQELDAGAFAPQAACSGANPDGQPETNEAQPGEPCGGDAAETDNAMLNPQDAYESGLEPEDIQDAQADVPAQGSLYDPAAVTAAVLSQADGAAPEFSPPVSAHHAAPYHAVPERDEPELAPPLTTGQYVGQMFLMALPVINIIMMIVWGYSDRVNPNRRNFARAGLVYVFIGIALAIVILGIFIWGLLTGNFVFAHGAI